MELILLLSRFAGDAACLILLYDFFMQPFRFYGLDPLSKFILKASRWLYGPFEVYSNRIVQAPDRNFAPLITVAIVLFIRGSIYGLASLAVHFQPLMLLLGMTLSFLELFTRLAIPMLLFVIYLDIQFARRQESFIGNVMVMMIHDLAKRVIVAIRRILPSYRPLAVFGAVFVLLWIFLWLLQVVTLLPFQQGSLLERLPRVIQPDGVQNITSPFLLLPAAFLQLAQTFLFGIFIILLLHMISGFSGLDPYDRTSILIGLAALPWIQTARRLFPFARVGMFDFSIAILLFLLWLLLDVITLVVSRLG